MTAETSTAETVLVGVLPNATITDAESIALARVEIAGSKVWGLGWQARGLDIEAELCGNLAKNFPVVDKFLEGDAGSIKSIDTTAKTYENAGRFEPKVRGYIDKVKDFNGARFDGVTIRSRDITSRSLDLAISAGNASPGQVAVLDRVTVYAKSVGVTLKVGPDRRAASAHEYDQLLPVHARHELRQHLVRR